MSDALKSNDLIESITRRASIPKNQNTFTNEDFLDFATEELMLSLVPQIMQLHEDFLMFEEEVPLVANKDAYAIPSRAISNKLRDVQVKYDKNNYQELTRIGIGDRFSTYAYDANMFLRSYYVNNNKIVFTPGVGPSPGADLVFIYYIKTAKLVTEDKIAVIKGINTTTGQLALDKIPEDFNTSVEFDIYKAESPYNIIKINIKPTAINSLTKTITFDPADLPDDLDVNDHLSLKGQAIIPQVPSEFHPLLAQMVACRCLESMNDTEGLKNAMVKLSQMQKYLGVLADNRVEDAPKKVLNRNGLLRNAMFRNRITKK